MSEPRNKEKQKSRAQTTAPEVSNVLDFGGLFDAFERIAGDFCLELGLNSLTDATQTQFSACCDKIRESIINPNKRYLTKSDKYSRIGDTGIVSNHNIYDVDKLERIYNIYLSFASKYDKVPTMNSFCRLCGVDYNTFWNWVNYINNGSEVSRRRLDFVKTIRNGFESGIREQLLTGRRNAVGLLGVANHDFGWNLPGVSVERSQPMTLSASELPRLDRLDPIDPPLLTGDTDGEQ